MKNRTIVIIIVACVTGFLALVGGIIGLVFYATSGVTETGDRFFAAAHEGDYKAAYALTSEELRRTSTPEEFKSFITSNGYERITDTSWSSRSISNDTGKLEGSLTTRTGGKIPIEIGLVYEMEQWKINSISRAKTGLGTAGLAAGPASRAPEIGPDVPRDANPAHLLFLIGSSFVDAMEDGDFFSFRLRWFDSISEVELARRFPRTPELSRRMEGLRNVRPRLVGARMNGAGQLVVKGVCEGGDDILVMEMTLEPQEANWRLKDFSYHFK